MKKFILPVITFIIGISFIALSVLKGKAEFGLFIIFPMVIGGGHYLLIGIVLIIISFLFPFFISLRDISQRTQKKDDYLTETSLEKKSKSRYGGVIFIGPIPIVFGKDKSIASKMMYIGLLIAVLLLSVYLIMILT